MVVHDHPGRRAISCRAGRRSEFPRPADGRGRPGRPGNVGRFPPGRVRDRPAGAGREGPLAQRCGSCRSGSCCSSPLLRRSRGCGRHQVSSASSPSTPAPSRRRGPGCMPGCRCGWGCSTCSTCCSWCSSCAPDCRSWPTTRGCTGPATALPAATGSVLRSLSRATLCGLPSRAASACPAASVCRACGTRSASHGGGTWEPTTCGWSTAWSSTCCCSAPTSGAGSSRPAGRSSRAQPRCCCSTPRWTGRSRTASRPTTACSCWPTSSRSSSPRRWPC